MPFRDDLTALSARHDALAAEVASKTRELEESRRMLDQAHARARLPVLDNIRVATPCTADWSQMTGDDRTRHCGECSKNVYNLSGMTREEAEALLIASPGSAGARSTPEGSAESIERNGDVCVRYFQRHDGTILLADCTVGVSRRRRRRLIAAGAATLLASGVAAAALRSNPRCSGDGSGEMVMGAVSVAQPAPAQEIQAEPPVREIKGKYEGAPAPKMGKPIFK